MCCAAWHITARAVSVSAVFLAVLGLAATPCRAQSSYVLFESGPVRPLALSLDGSQLFAVNTPDGVLEIFDVDAAGIYWTSSVQVGMEPVAVAARTDSEVWVINHLSDSVSIVDVSAQPRVIRTLLVGDEPRDIVFAGPGKSRAFITTAHRGQNSPYPSGEYNTPGIGRADVWVFDGNDTGANMGGTPLTIINLFSDRPRSLAASADGSKVYAAGFRTGNQTATVIEQLVCDTNNFNLIRDLPQGPCTLNGNALPGGYPPPHSDSDGVIRPETGLIVKLNRDGYSPGTWQDELGRDWNNGVNFHLPDEDVFEIDANADPPVQVDSFASVGTVLFNMAINPVNGALYVSNTESQNQVRFEGFGVRSSGIKPSGEPASVRGHLAESRITVVKNGDVSPRHLNKHIPYDAVTTPADVKARSLATPLGVAVSDDGNTLYVAAFGSGKIGVFNTAELESDSFTPSEDNHIALSDGGPGGLVLGSNRLYALTRFGNSVVVVDLTLGTVGEEIQRVPLHSPEPESVIAGRPFLYDALATSSNGEASCASCHVFGDMDDLAWDLGNPDGALIPNGNPFLAGISQPFHPMKGPMTTQSLRGLLNSGPQHWRGDRQGNSDEAFNAFNQAFPALLGRDEGLIPAPDMQTFTDFVLKIVYPPNPSRQLDNSLSPNEEAGRSLYAGRDTDGVGNCITCHRLDPLEGFFGSEGLSVTVGGEDQDFKIPQLRNAYQKVGMFGMFSVGGLDGPFIHTGDQVRGFGFLHDGSVDTVFRFHSNSSFGLSALEQANLESFLVSYDSDLPPVVGQQLTRTATNGPVVDSRIDLILNLATTPYPSQLLGAGSSHCDVIAKGTVDDEQKGWVFQTDGTFLPDDGSGAISATALRAIADSPGQEITYTAVPYGSGVRTGVDRDEDGVFNGLDNCPAAYNPLQEDLDEDDVGDACIDAGLCVGDDYSGDTDWDGVCDDTDNCIFVENSDQSDLDGDSQGNSCDSHDGLVSVRRVIIWKSARRSGRVRASGVVNYLDVSNGLTLGFSDGLSMTAHGSVPSADCRNRKKNRIVCLAHDKSTKVAFFPDRFTPERFRFKASLRKLAVDDPQAGPIVTSLAFGLPVSGIDIIGVASDCREGKARLVCK